LKYPSSHWQPDAIEGAELSAIQVSHFNGSEHTLQLLWHGRQDPVEREEVL
jgi:hypothetical protein